MNQICTRKRSSVTLKLTYFVIGTDSAEQGSKLVLLKPYELSSFVEGTEPKDNEALTDVDCEISTFVSPNLSNSRMVKTKQMA